MTGTPSESGPSVAQAYSLYLEHRDWPAALAAWQAIEEAAGASIESRLAIAHCRIELADDAALPDIVVGALPSAGGARRDDIAALVRRRAYECLLTERPRSAQLTRLLAAADSHLQHVYATAILPQSPPRPLPDPPASPPPLPFEEDAVPDDDVAALIERHRHRRVLLLMRFHPAPGHTAVVADSVHNMRACLDELGITHVSLDSHPAHHEHADFADRLRRTIADAAPDIILIDDPITTGVTVDPAHAETVLATLAAARAGGAKLVAQYPDGWHPAIPALINRLADQLDLIVMVHGAQFGRLSATAAGKLLYFPFPVVDPRPPGSMPTVLKPRACVLGRINWANEARLVWWNEIVRRGLPVDIHPTVFGEERSRVDYAHLCGSYAINIDLTMRTSGVRILTGRTIEVPLYGSVLLEEANEDAAYFFRPHDHYVPFSTLHELEARLETLLADAPRRQRIAQAGQDWARRQFTGRQFWAQALRRLYET